jgi:hypothetical protein
MFIVSAKLTRKKMIGAAVIAGIVLITVIFLLTNNNSVEASSAANKKIKTNDDRIAFLSSMGWDVSSEPVETQEVLIPETWDAAFLHYNQLQAQQGFDLAKYKNKKVTRYSYRVANHPSGENGVSANLLCYKNRVIGGDIQSSAPNGFLHGLEENRPGGAEPQNGEDAAIQTPNPS